MKCVVVDAESLEELEGHAELSLCVCHRICVVVPGTLDCASAERICPGATESVPVNNTAEKVHKII